jgi:Mg-chelatase subunit ChlD
MDMTHRDALVVGSLADVAQKSNASLAETFIGCDAVVIVDVSGSMDARDSRGGKSRYDVALEELAALQQALPGRVAVIAFSSIAIFVPGGRPPFLGGSTNLADALQFAKVADVPTGDMRFFVISDGEPDDRDAALQVAKTYHNKISTVYVGPEAHPVGREFLEKLAGITGGQHVVADRVQELARVTQQLLLS